jgi:glycosyltransferase involved in cell wall biosynthesis
MMLARPLIKTGMEVHVLLEDCAENRDWVKRFLPGACAHFHARLSFPKCVAERRRVIREVDPDIVHVMGIGLKNALLIPRRSRRPGKAFYVADFDELVSAGTASLPARLLHRVIERKTVRDADGIICASKQLCERMARISGNRLVPLYLRYAFDPEMYDNCGEEAATVRQRYGGRSLVVYMGTVSGEYQSRQVLDLAERMQGRRDCIQFLIIGGGRGLDAVRKRVKDGRMEDYVELSGYVTPDDVIPAYLMAADVLLFPIADTTVNRARCPNKTFLYIGAGRPVVTNRVGEVASVMGAAGYYYDFDDLADFEGVVARALSERESYDPGLLQKVHTWEKRCEEYLSWLSLR